MAKMDKEEITTLRIAKRTKARFFKWGRMDETADDLLNRLLKKLEFSEATQSG